MSKNWKINYSEKELREMAKVDAEERMATADTIKQLDREYEQGLTADQKYKHLDSRKRFISRQKELDAVKDDRNFEYDYEVKGNSNDRGR